MEPALSEMFAASIRLRVDPVLGEFGFQRVPNGPWHRAVYGNRGRFVVFQVHLDPRDGPRYVMVTLGNGAPAGVVAAGSGVPLGRLGGRDWYPIAGARQVASVLEAVVADLIAHAGDFLAGRGMTLAMPAASAA